MEQRQELIRLFRGFREDGDTPVEIRDKLTDVYGEFDVAHLKLHNRDAYQLQTPSTGLRHPLFNYCRR